MRMDYVSCIKSCVSVGRHVASSLNVTRGKTLNSLFYFQNCLDRSYYVIILVYPCNLSNSREDAIIKLEIIQSI